MASAWLPPVDPWTLSDKGSFAYKSVSQRWPTIITSAIDSLYQASYALSYSSDRALAAAKIDESKALVERLSKLKHDMSRDKPLEPIGEDGGDSTKEYDEVVKQKQWTWYSAPWLFAECYMYRLIRSIFARSQHWTQYDPFSTQKLGAFRSSAAAVATLADAVEGLIRKAEAGAQQRKAARADDADELKRIDDGLHVIFRELIQTSLWGNATDLSLLTHLKHEDLQQLQAGGLGAEAQAKREKFILSGLGGIDRAWQTLLAARSTGQPQRVDIILDNSGFELYTDLILADFLVASGAADHVVFHPKDMPWFVSDVTPADLLFTLEALQSPDFFSKAQQGNPTSSPVPPRTSRSSSRQRAMVMDMAHLEGERRDMSPAGSRVLRMESVREEGTDKAQDTEAYGSRTLQRGDTSGQVSSLHQRGASGRAEEAEQSALGEQRGRPSAQTTVGGSRSLQLDPAYFQNARSRTVSPSRSFVMDTSSMHSFSSAMKPANAPADEEDRRGRSAVNEHTTSAQRLASRWSQYLTSGKFALSIPSSTPLGGSPSLVNEPGQGSFWTSYHNYPSMPLVAPKLHETLRQSALVVSKGDLNYRKWTSDARWPFDTPFEQTLGPITGTLNLLVLRTNKADVCVGVPKERLATLDQEDPEWRMNGKYAVVEFVSKNAGQ